MASTLTFLVVVLAIGFCHGHSLHFKSLIHDIVVPEIKEKVSADLKHLNVKLPDSVSDLHLPTNTEDLDRLKPALKEVEKKLPTDLQHLASNLQDSASDLHVNLKDVDKNLKPLLKGLEKEIFKDLNFKGTNGSCGCAAYKCSCCEHLEIKKIDLDNTVCVAVAYVKQDIGVEFTLTVDGKAYINETISVRNPPPICVGIPYLKKEASICIRVSKLNIDKVSKRVSGCVSILARLLRIKVEEIPIGCFNMPFRKAVGGSTVSNKTQMSKQAKMDMLSRLGLMGKTFNNGRLVNQNLPEN